MFLSFRQGFLHSLLFAEKVVASSPRDDFLTFLDTFAAVLGTAQASLSDVIKLSDSTAPQLAEGVTPMQYRELSQSVEVVQAMEGCLTIWCDEINLVRELHSGYFVDSYFRKSSGTTTIRQEQCIHSVKYCTIMFRMSAKFGASVPPPP